LARNLTEMGFNVVRIIVVPDNYEDIAWAVKESLNVSDILITTGGLGFTKDDVTLEAIAKTLGLKLVLNLEALDMIKRKVGENIASYSKAAYLPETSKPLFNPVGVSPGVYLEIMGKKMFILPGVPSEMMKMFEDQVKAVLASVLKQYSARIIIVTDHEKEREVDERISEIRAKYSDSYFKTHASTPVQLSVVISSSSTIELENKVNEILSKLREVIRIRDVIVEKKE